LPFVSTPRSIRTSVDRVPVPRFSFPASDFSNCSEELSGSSPLIPAAFARADFGSMHRDSSSLFDLLEFSTTGEGYLHEDAPMDTIDEFSERIEKIQRTFPTESRILPEEVRKAFADVQSELTAIAAQSHMNADKIVYTHVLVLVY
jgi:hypothetical protein